MAITTAEVRVYSAEKCDELFTRKGDVPKLPEGLPTIIVLGPQEDVPAGTKAGTIIVRRSK